MIEKAGEMLVISPAFYILSTICKFIQLTVFKKDRHF